MSTNLGLPILIYKWKRISSPRFIGPCLHTAYPCCSVTMSCLTLCIPKNFSTPGFPVLHYLPEFDQTHVHWVGGAIQLPHILSPPSPLALNISHIWVFSNELALCIRWPKYWSFSISPCNEYSSFISFKIDWFDLLAVQGTLKSLLQHHSSKASILRRSAYFMVQPSVHDHWK